MARRALLSRSAALLRSELLGALYPPVCRVCRERLPASERATGAACAEHALPDPDEASRRPHCDRCARPLPEMLPDGTRCAACRRNRPRFSRVITLGDYRREQGLRDWILALKHGGRRDLAEPLGRALARRLQREVSGGVLLVPVPIHPLRRLERGYDQAQLLARAVAAASIGDGQHPAVCRSLLRRRRWTPPQGALGSVSRQANVAHAFVPREQAPVDLLGVAVWLVDDVLTSGATVGACAQVLGQLGARRVSVLCVARAGDVTT